MVTESFAIVRSGEKIAYIAVYQNGTDGVNLMYDDEFITYRSINDVDIEKLIDAHNLRYKSLKLVVNMQVSDFINTNIQKDRAKKEINLIVENDKFILENEEFKTNSKDTWFREVYFYFLREDAVIDYKQWEAERIYRYGY